VNASDALDDLLEMVKSSSAKEIPYDPDSELYVVSEEND
jgi:hypothetical protein